MTRRQTAISALTATTAAAAACGLAVVLPAIAATSYPHTKAPVLRPGTYSGTVTMAPVSQRPGSSVQITLAGTWRLRVDRLDHVTGTESLTGTMPITPSGGCTASPNSYTLGFQAVFGKKSFGVTGGPGFVQGKAVVIDLDSQTGAGSATDQGWSATPNTYQLTCGNLAPSTDDILFFGELGVPIVTYTLRLPLGLFGAIGHRYALRVANVENTKFTQTFTLERRP